MLIVAEDKERKNCNDEAIVAAALYRATVDDKGVVIISRDKDLEITVREITRCTHAENCAAPLFLDALQKGKISIVHDFNAERRYKIAWSSGDYRPNHPFHIPERLRNAVGICEAVIRAARTSAIPQPEAQILYTTKA